MRFFSNLRWEKQLNILKHVFCSIYCNKFDITITIFPQVYTWIGSTMSRYFCILDKNWCWWCMSGFILCHFCSIFLQVDGIFQVHHVELWTKSILHQVETLRNSKQTAETCEISKLLVLIPILLCVPNSNERAKWDNEESIRVSTDRTDRLAWRISLRQALAGHQWRTECQRSRVCQGYL